MIKDVRIFLEIPRWLHRKEVETRAAVDGITMDEARDRIFNEDNDEDF